MAYITGDQFELLEAIVDAYGHIVDGQKSEFMYYTEGAMAGTSIQHPGLEGDTRRVGYPDLEELEALGLIRMSHGGTRSGSMTPTADGIHVVEEERRLRRIAHSDEALSSTGGGSGVEWETVLPVLQAVYDLYSESPAGEDVTQPQVNSRLQREEADPATSRAFEVLSESGYVRDINEIDAIPGPLTVIPTERTLQLLGGWPADGDVARERLVAILQARIEETTDPEEKSRLQGLLSSAQSVGEKVMAEVLTRVLMGG